MIVSVRWDVGHLNIDNRDATTVVRKRQEAWADPVEASWGGLINHPQTQASDQSMLYVMPVCSSRGRLYPSAGIEELLLKAEESLPAACISSPDSRNVIVNSSFLLLPQPSLPPLLHHCLHFTAVSPDFQTTHTV